MPDSSRRDPAADPPSSGALAEAVSVLKKATESLQGSRAPRESSTTAAPEGDGRVEDEREVYYRHLEERGALTDVDAGTDLSSLPPTTTHVRYPDGRVERMGYS